MMRDPLDDLLEPTEEDLFGMDEWLAHGDGDVYDDDDDAPSEIVIRIIDVVDGSTSIKEISERLYDYADELVNLSNTGWDLIETVSKGQGVAIILDERSDDNG